MSLNEHVSLKFTLLSALLLLSLLFGLSTGPALAQGEGVIISEVAWAGTEASWADEWLELHNVSRTDKDLSGWTISWEDTEIKLTDGAKIPAGGYYLLERTDQKTVKSVKAKSLFTGGLSNDGEKITLRDETGKVIEMLDFREGWPAGGSFENKERVSMVKVRGSWKNSRGNWKEKDAEGNLIPGTPGYGSDGQGEKNKTD